MAGRTPSCCSPLSAPATGDRSSRSFTFDLGLPLISTTYCIVDDLQGLRFHVKPLVGTFIQRVGLEQERQQRRPHLCGCPPGGEQDRRRPVTGQARHLEQAELSYDPEGETKREAEEVKSW